MKIVVCASISQYNDAVAARDYLEKRGYKVILPYTMNQISAGKMTVERNEKNKKSGSDIAYVRKNDLIREHYREIKKADAILVANGPKHGIKNYIGANVFLEIGFAYVLGKKIFIMNDLPEDVPILPELKVINPKVLKGKLNLIK